MAKGKKANPDRHASGFMVRLPEEYRQALKAAQVKTGRSFTVEVKWALDAHFAALGISVTKKTPKGE